MMVNNRILFVNNSSQLGIGTSSSLLLLLKYLHNDYDCAVISDRHSGQLPKALEEIAVPHYALADRFILYLPSLVNLILRGKYDLVYANGSNERSRGAFWAAKITRRPLIWHIRESLRRKKYAGTIRFADCVIANSNDTAERLTRYANVNDPIVIANGVEVPSQECSKESARDKLGTLYGLNHDWLRVVNVGRICPDKNQADVIRIAGKVVTHFPKIYFFIIGLPEADYLAYLKELVTRLDLEQHVILLDYTPDVKEILQGCDLMLHVSKKESQGRVLLEAMSAQLPVVAYKVGGVGEAIVDGLTGYLVPLGDLEMLVKLIEMLAQDSNLRYQMGLNGFKRVQERFTAEKTAQMVNDVIEQTLQKRTLVG